MTAAERFVKRILGGGNKEGLPKGDSSESVVEGKEKTAKDELYEALVEDELPKDKTLAEHDKERHPDGFNPETDSCKFREEMKKETDSDKVDEISPESAPKADGGDRGEDRGENPKAEYNAVVRAFTNPDGTKKEGWMKAPNGKSTNLTERQWVQVRTPSFKKWFGDWENTPEEASKVVDENGEPRVVWHGSDWDILSEEPGKAFFDKSRVGQTFDDVDIDYNFFFTASEKSAYGYGEITSFFLNIRNPELRGVRVGADMTNERELHEAIINGHDLGTNVDEYGGAKISDADGLIMSINRIDAEKAKGVKEEFSERIKQLVDKRHQLIERRLSKASSQEYINSSGEDRERLNTLLQNYLKEESRIKEELEEVRSERDKRMPTVKVHNVDMFGVDEPNQIKSATDNNGAFSTQNPDVRDSSANDEVNNASGEFGEDFFSNVYPDRKQSYSSEFGTDDGEEKAQAEEAYKENFTKDGKYKPPFEDGRFSKEILEKAREGQNGQESEVWDESSRANAEAAGRVLSNILGGVTFELSDRPYGGSNGDSRKSISGIFTGTSADYANESRQGGVGDGPSLMKIGSGEGSQVYGWGLYGSNQRGVAETYADETSDRQGYTGYSKGGKLIKTNEGSGDVESDAATMLALYGDVETAKKEALSFPNGEAIAKELDENGKGYKEEWPHRNIYEQTFFTNRVPGDESHLLKWYEPVSEEMKRKILNSLDSLKASDVEGLKTWEVTDSEAEEDLNDLKTAIRARLERSEELTGEDLYRLFAYTKTPSHYQMGVKAASGVLSKLDIDGIKYPVDSYGGKAKKDGNEAGWNYVSFRDDNIRVDHKWVDGEQRYFRNSAGKVVGEYNRATKQITLYPGAKIKDVVHEYAHGLWQFAEQEAKDGRGNLLDNLHRIADSAPSAVKDAVYKNYADEKNPNVLLEECFTHELARRSEQNERFARAVKTASGKQWYKRAWGVIKDTWKGLATKLGFNKADTSKMDGMSAHDAAEYILSQMAQGKRFGSVNPDDTPDGEKKGDTRKSFIGEKGAANLGIGHLDEAKKMTEDGVDRKEVWQKTGWWKGKDGKWKIEIPDVMLNTDSKLLEAYRNFPSPSHLYERKERIRKERDTVLNEQDKMMLSKKFQEAQREYDEAFQTMKKKQEERSAESEVYSLQRLTDVIEDTELFDAYPELKKAFVTLESMTNYNGLCDGRGMLIRISGYSQTLEEFKATLTHEIQHLIQRIEGFGQGSNPEVSGWDDYWRHSGEVESRNVSKRLSMSRKDRLVTPPWETEDVSEDEQIVKK